MKRFVLAFALLVPSLAAATEADDFLALLRRFGITEGGFTSKKPCLCSGGSLNGTVGTVIVDQTGTNGSFVHLCFVPMFDAAGSTQAAGNCVSAGGTFVVVSK
jgi:hypothetical protein